MKRINVGDTIIAGTVGVGGAVSGLSRGVTVLLAIATILASIGLRHLWQNRRKDGAK